MRNIARIQYGDSVLGRVDCRIFVLDIFKYIMNVIILGLFPS
jgi:hypothetical protein